MKNKYLSDMDAFLKSDYGTAFDRTCFSRRKTGERRALACETAGPGQTVRSGRDRRVMPDRRRGWEKKSGDTFDMTSVET